MIEQDRGLGQIDRFGLKIGEVERQHLNQARIIRNTGFGAVREEGKAQCVNSEMPLNPIRRFVKQKPFESTLALQVFFTAWESMMINVVQRGFCTCSRTCACNVLISCSMTPAARHCL